MTAQGESPSEADGGAATNVNNQTSTHRKVNPMPKPENQSCENCLFMVMEVSPYGGDPDPHCHRMPIAFYAQSIQEERPGTLDKTTVNIARCGWPDTKNDNWCGEWMKHDYSKQCPSDDSLGSHMTR